jgi:S-DNA-T family DNA segregation ATPase FtsK/SpoIIIE
MFRRRRRIKKDPLDYIALPKLKLNLDPDTKKGIFIVLILLLGAISLLGLFNLAGAMGVYLANGLELLFGWSKWIVPIILIIYGFFLYSDGKYYIRGAAYFGIFLFIISLQTILHYFIGQSEWKAMIDYGVGGGYIGYFSSSIFYKLLGFWGGILAALGLFLISLMLILNTTLANILGPESWLAKLLYHPIAFIFNKAFRRGEKEYLDEEGEIGIEDKEEGGFEEKLGEEEEYMGTVFSKKQVKDESALSEIYFNEKGKTSKGDKEEKLWKKSNIKIDLPLDLLNGRIGKPTSGDIKNNTVVIQKTLENFGILVEMGEVSVGPTVTQYTFKPAEGVKLSQITTLGNDLALALAAHPIRIEAPIPGKSLVGVEVPNQAKAIVGLKEILSSQEFKARKSNLMLGLGKDVSGKSWMYDLARMPHLLVAGATNSGKSVCLNSVIVSLLYQNNPDDLRFIMVDPKRVELTVYNGLPHLLTPVIVEVNKTINALRWCLNEMDRRFEILNKSGKRDITSYNINETGKNGDLRSSGAGKMPHIVFVIDELADLMVAAGRDIEAGVIRLAQMARAVGIHLVLATQRPSVDVITGLIKANMPARIAFSVASGTDSRTILDSLGAEKLLGRGDMLFITAEMSKPKRLQGTFVSESEIRKIKDYINERGGEPSYMDEVTERQKVMGIAGVGMDGANEIGDDLLEEAKELIINSGKASASFLQRRLSIGYARAARILDILEEIGVVGPVNGSKPREILISVEQYDKIINQGVSGVALHKREEKEAPEEYLKDKNEDDNGEEDEEDIDEEEEEYEGELESDEAENKEVGSDDLPVHAEIEEKGDEKSKKDFEFEDKFFSR